MTQSRPLRFYAQLALTLATAGFMVVPVIMSLLAGVTENYFAGLRGGLTLRWVATVWNMYDATVWLSLRIALTCLAVLATTDLQALEEAAASLGAGFMHRFVTVIIPNAVPGIVAGALTVLTLSIGEFNLTWMLHTPLTKTLPVGLADSYASMRLEIASAYTLIFLVLLFPLLVGIQIAGRRLAGGNKPQ